MKRIICLMLTMMCFLILTEEKYGQSVYGQSWLEYDQTTNTVRAVAYSAPDYSVDIYYCVEVQMTLYEDEDSVGWQGGMNVNESGWPTACIGNAEVELLYPYDPNSTYFLESSHSITMVQIPQQTSYNDPYGFYQYLNGDPVYFPAFFNFAGTGYPSGQSLAGLLLGFTFSLLQGGVTSGPPHHLRVIHDQDVVRTDLCGQLQKLINFQIVDQVGKPAGKAQIDERPQNVTDTCSGTIVGLTTCGNSDVSNFGNFTDGIKTGCPHIGPSVCGFDFFNRWRWCRSTPYTFDYVDLAWMYYDATRTVIKIDGETDIQDLTYKFP